MAKASAVEDLKRASGGLRGALGEEFANDLDHLSNESGILLKFHGAYQQDDRDLRKAQHRKSHSFMVRVSVPGGVMTAEQYLALDALADTVADGRLRITSRGGLQYHYVGKRDLRSLMQALAAAGRSTLAACGDVVRNVVWCAAPFESDLRREVSGLVRLIDRELKPRTRAYAEVFLDGEKAASLEAADEPLYGAAYLPRKFKIGFALEGENTTDIFSHDLGFVAHEANGRLEGFTLLAGGGLGMTHHQKETFPRLAGAVGFVTPGQALEAARAAVTIHRDFGDRDNRKHARLKYLLAERGADWFRGELEARAGLALGPARNLTWRRQADYLGWHEQAPGRWFFGLRVLNGRLAGGMRAGVREVVERLGCEVRFTAQQNLVFAGLPVEQRALVERILASHGAPLPAELPPVLRHSMACVALPTCGLSLAEGERALPGVAAAIQERMDRAGVGGEPLHLRMTGCPNGCARPYTAEIGIVGQSPNLYSIFLGGSPMATRLGRLWRQSVKSEDIAEALAPLVSAYAEGRRDGEAFGDYCERTGVVS
jgi:sulfite reductase (ferredoxin)